MTTLKKVLKEHPAIQAELDAHVGKAVAKATSEIKKATKTAVADAGKAATEVEGLTKDHKTHLKGVFGELKATVAA